MNELINQLLSMITNAKSVTNPMTATQKADAIQEYSCLVEAVGKASKEAKVPATIDAGVDRIGLEFSEKLFNILKA